MTPLSRGLAIAVVHVSLVAVVGGVLLYERNALPSVWALTTGVDPVLPIRGRYVSLNLVVEPRGELPEASAEPVRMEIVGATLSVEDGRLVATVLPPVEAVDTFGWRGQAIQRRDTPAGPVWATVEAIAFFLPEDAPDPTRLKPGQQLWAEVTVPHDGPPRPIRLEVR
jgi:hypothetical protein